MPESSASPSWPAGFSVWCATRYSPCFLAPGCNTMLSSPRLEFPICCAILFAEGALSAAFVTTFTQVQQTKGEQEAFRLSNRVATALMLLLTLICIIGWIFAPSIVYLLAPGFFDVPGKADLTIHLTRIMIPFLLLIALAAKAMGILNARDNFAVPAIAPVFFNLGSVLAGLFLGFTVGSFLGLSPIEGMAFGTLVGGFLQFAVQWPSLRRAGFRYRPMLSITDPGVRQIMRLMGPAIIGTAAVQINVFVNTNFASAIIDPATGAVAQWPGVLVELSLFASCNFPSASSASPSPPRRCRRYRAARRIPDYDEFRQTLAHALALVFLLCIPSAVGTGGPGPPDRRAGLRARQDSPASTRCRPLMPWPLMPSVLQAMPRSKCSRRRFTRSTMRARRC